MGEITRILLEKKPKDFIWENVQGLVDHNRGSTLKTILDILENDLNYFVPTPQILNAKCFGMPQNRSRIFILGIPVILSVINR